MKDRIEHTLRKFADDLQRMGRVTDSLQGKIKSQNDPESLEKWFETNRVKFNKEKHNVLHLGQSNRTHRCRPEKRLARLQYCREGHGVTADNKVNMRRQCAIIANKPTATWSVVTVVEGWKN